MYRRPKFLEILLEIRREMSLEAGYDVDLFVEMARSGGTLRPPAETVVPPVVSADNAESPPAVRLSRRKVIVKN